MSSGGDDPTPVGEAGRDAAPASLAARVGSLVAAAADPHTQAITVWNGAPTASGGRIEVEINLQDDGGGYEVVDAEGDLVAHLWLGNQGMPPTRLDLMRSEIPDFEAIMARLDGDRLLGIGILEVSMRVLRDTLHLELTLGDRNGLSRRELEESVRDAQSLADDAGCGRIALILHRAVLLRLAVWTPPVPAWGYTTLLVRPRPKRAARTGKVGAPPAELFPAIEQDSSESPRQQAFAYPTAHAEGERRTLPEFRRAGAGNLHTQVGPCVDGILPPRASLVKVSPETVVVSAFHWTENDEGAVLRLSNESNHAENARLEMLLPAYAAELITPGGRSDEILWESEPHTDFTVAVPPSGVATIRLRW
jgi:hypothetical protein